jgi:hypothetical protein
MPPQLPTAPSGIGRRIAIGLAILLAVAGLAVAGLYFFGPL